MENVDKQLLDTDAVRGRATKKFAVHVWVSEFKCGLLSCYRCDGAGLAAQEDAESDPTEEL